MLRKFFSNNVINPSRRKLLEVTISLTFFTFVPTTKKINRGNLKAGLEQFGVYFQRIRYFRKHERPIIYEKLKPYVFSSSKTKNTVTETYLSSI